MTLYEVLLVAPDASQEQIKRAWRAGMKRTHPDVGGSAADAMQVQAAYDVLGDPIRRASYDRQLAESTDSSEASQKFEDLIAKIVQDLAETLASEIARRLAEVIAESWRAGSPASGYEEGGAERLFALRDRVDSACIANTASGRPCMRNRSESTVYCWQHLAQLRSGDLAPTRFPDGRAQCAAITKGGRRCRSTAIVGGRCHQHGGARHQAPKRLEDQPAPHVAGDASGGHKVTLILVAVIVLILILVIL